MKSLIYQTDSALWLLGLVFTGLIACTLVRRFRAGVTLRALVGSGFYEVFPIRLLCQGLHLAVWWIAIRLLLLLAEMALDSMGDGPGVEIASMLQTGCAALVAGACGLWIFKSVIRPARHGLPEVNLPDHAIRRGIEPEAFAEVGRESFPSPVTARRPAEWMGRLMVLAICLLWGVSAAMKLDGSDSDMVLIAEGGMAVIRVFAGLSEGWGGGLTNACMPSVIVALAVLLFWNRGYGLIRFVQSVAITGFLACLAMLLCEMADQGGDSALKWSIALSAMISLRMIRDLRAARSYLKMRRVADPITAAMRSVGLDLASLEHREDCALPEIDAEATRRRIAQGCRNAEKSDPLVQRNFARFLKLAGVEIQHTSIAARRFLTVGRYTTETGCGGTPSWLSDPVVPMWDERLFPLRVPEGYVNHLDTILLGSAWDRVSICGGCAGTGNVNCGSCGGSGAVHVNNERKTCTGCGGSGRLVCGTCSGHGRLLFRRHLNTSWKRLMPALSSPDCGMAELMEDAEERVYFRESIIEDRKEVKGVKNHDGLKVDLARNLESAANQLRAAHASHADRVVALHGARHLYRSDFIVAAFWTIRIRCGWLRGGCGWFFGKRPEFHFPILPLSLGNWASIAVGLPLLAGLGLHWNQTLNRLLDLLR